MPQSPKPWASARRRSRGASVNCWGPLMDDPDLTIRRLERDNTFLRRRVAEMECRTEDDDVACAMISEQFEVSKIQARMILILYRHKGTLPKDQLAKRARSASWHSVVVIMVDLRKSPKIGPDGIRTVRHAGYCLSQDLRDKISLLLTPQDQAA